MPDEPGGDSSGRRQGAISGSSRGDVPPGTSGMRRRESLVAFAVKFKALSAQERRRGKGTPVIFEYKVCNLCTGSAIVHSFAGFPTLNASPQARSPVRERANIKFTASRTDVKERRDVPPFTSTGDSPRTMAAEMASTREFPSHRRRHEIHPRAHEIKGSRHR